MTARRRPGTCWCRACVMSAACPVRADARVLARLKGPSREHGESDRRCYLTWCAGHSLDPLAAQRPHLELKVIML